MLDLNAIRECYTCYDAKEGKMAIAAMESLLRRICRALGVDESVVDEEGLVAEIERRVRDSDILPFDLEGLGILCDQAKAELEAARQRIAELEEKPRCQEQSAAIKLPE